MTNIIVFIGKIRNIIAAVIGTAEAVLPMVKELVVDVLRVTDAILALLCVPLPFLKKLSDKLDSEPAIKKVNEIYTKIIGAIEKLKSALLVLK